MPNRESQQGTDVLTEQKQKLQKPPLYKVLLHNDNYTTMEFVVYVLVTIFHHSEGDAIRIMLQVHHQDIGIAGVYTFEVAETKVAKVAQMAREHDYPLLCTLEEE
jgi:ATP-dependent Clp protease adaptor protein ClpS